MGLRAAVIVSGMLSVNNRNTAIPVCCFLESSLKFEILFFILRGKFVNGFLKFIVSFSCI